MPRLRSLSWPLAAWTSCHAVAPAHAAPAPVPAELHLEWSAPPACPPAADVRARVEAALRRPTLAGGPAATRVTARVSNSARGYALMLETRTAGADVDVRRMTDRSCEVLAEAAAVIVATAIDEVDPHRAPPVLPPPPPVAVSDLSPGPGEPPAPKDMSFGPAPALAPKDMSPGPATSPAPKDTSPGPSPAPPPTPPAVTSLSATRDPDLNLSPGPAPARLSAALRLAALADVGATPGVAGGLTGGVGLLAPRWRLDLAAVWLAPRPTPALADIDARADIGALAAQLRGCALPRLGPVALPACLGFEAGGVRGEGQGSALTRSFVDWRPWLAAVAGTGLAWSFTASLALVVQLDLLVPLARPSFLIGGLEVHRSGAAAGRLALGLEVRLPARAPRREIR